MSKRSSRLLLENKDAKERLLKRVKPFWKTSRLDQKSISSPYDVKIESPDEYGRDMLLQKSCLRGYELKEVLGYGTNIVYECEKDGKRYAMKIIILNSETTAHDVNREVHISKRMHALGVGTKIHEAWSCDGKYVDGVYLHNVFLIVMDIVPGIPLSIALRRRYIEYTFNLKDKIDSLLKHLDWKHADINTGNIMIEFLNDDKTKYKLRLIDFGRMNYTGPEKGFEVEPYDESNEWRKNTTFSGRMNRESYNETVAQESLLQKSKSTSKNKKK